MHNNIRVTYIVIRIWLVDNSLDTRQMHNNIRVTYNAYNNIRVTYIVIRIWLVDNSLDTHQMHNNIRVTYIVIRYFLFLPSGLRSGSGCFLGRLSGPSLFQRYGSAYKLPLTASGYDA